LIINKRNEERYQIKKRRNFFKNQFDESYYKRKNEKIKNRTKYAILDILEKRSGNYIKTEINKINEFSNEESYESSSIKRSASGNAKIQEDSDLFIIEKNLNEFKIKSDCKNQQINREENIKELGFLEQLLKEMETDIEFYKCFRLSEDKCVKNSK